MRRFKWWLRSVDNYRRGFAYGPVRRYRCCGHTTPFHTPDCPATAAEEKEPAT
jgi:hypothetical protein